MINIKIAKKVKEVDPKAWERCCENLIVKKIRRKYSVNEELAILRQRDTKPTEFAEYNAYVEACKAEAKAEMQL